ncbi:MULTISPECIES: hypothetical protein [unclassified Granulicatella]|uniref:phage tail protein n=1 Tax=unclassified Granulicatella TaxID=2630493 RepID=UPI00107412E8|nr:MULTISPECIES: hypothetical protein [unclassified Granulicatella]MBF0779798.1 hypothetical protein [Granulicatella sp. 19428wC4_WM01]TFU96200.1 hypothetical protein E4T68_01700 [Granulicatella sp. WM01]
MASGVNELFKIETAAYIKAMEQVRQQVNAVKDAMNELKGVVENLNIVKYLSEIGGYSIQMALEVSAAINQIKLTMEESTQAFLKWGEIISLISQAVINEIQQFAEKLQEVVEIFITCIQSCIRGVQELDLLVASLTILNSIVQDSITVLNILQSAVDEIKEKIYLLVEVLKSLVVVDFSPMVKGLMSFLCGVPACLSVVIEKLEYFLNNILIPLSKLGCPEKIISFFNCLNSKLKETTSGVDVFKDPIKWLTDKFFDYISKWTGGNTIISDLSKLISILRKTGDWCKELKPILDILIPVIEIFMGLWKGIEILSFIGQAGGLMNAIKQIGDAIKAATITKIKDKLETIQLNLMYAADAIAKGASTVATGALTAATVLLTTAMTVLTSPITLIIAAIAALVAVGYLLVTNWDTVCAVATQVWQMICDFIGGVCQAIADFFVGLWNGLVETFQGVAQWFGEMFQQAWDGIVGIFSGLGEWFNERWNDIVNIFTGVGQWFGEMFQQAWDGIVGIFSGLGEWFNERWNDIVNIFTGVGQWFGNMFQQAWDGITNIFSVAGSWFGNIWNNIQGVFSGVGSFFDNLFRGAWNTITGIFSAIPEWFSNIFSNAWAGVRDIFSTGGRIFSGIVDGISGVFKRVVNAIIGGINKVIAVPFNVINGALDGLRGIEILGVSPFGWLPRIGVPQIPQLARGGIVDSATLAIVGEAGREAVMPLENNTGWISELADKISVKLPAYTGSDKPQNIILQLPNGREFARWTVGAINELQSNSPYPLLNF